MVGFLKGLFGGKGNGKASVPADVRPARQDGEGYYLSSDDARTYGNVDYMRTAKKTRRTFPKTVDNKELEFEQEVSSINTPNGLGTQIPKMSIGSFVSSAPASRSNGAVPSDASVSQRRKSDSSLDVFRKMAKDMGK